jgi:hypothetical protein
MKRMKKSSIWLGLAIGAAIGTAIGYVAASDKKEEWLEDVNNLVDKVKSGVKDVVAKGKKSIEE